MRRNPVQPRRQRPVWSGDDYDEIAASSDEDDEEDNPLHDCRACGRGDRPEEIVLCDRCDRGYHLACLRPPLPAVPEGAWYCPRCMQPRQRARPARQRVSTLRHARDAALVSQERRARALEQLRVRMVAARHRHAPDRRQVADAHEAAAGSSCASLPVSGAFPSMDEYVAWDGRVDWQGERGPLHRPRRAHSVAATRALSASSDDASESKRLRIEREPTSGRPGSHRLYSVGIAPMTPAAGSLSASRPQQVPLLQGTVLQLGKRDPAQIAADRAAQLRMLRARPSIASHASPTATPEAVQQPVTARPHLVLPSPPPPPPPPRPPRLDKTAVLELVKRELQPLYVAGAIHHDRFKEIARAATDRAATELTYLDAAAIRTIVHACLGM